MADQAPPRSAFGASPPGGRRWRTGGAGSAAVAGLRAAVAAAVVSLACGVAGPLAHASEAPSASANPQLEARMMAISAELRCLVCQNQTIADSHASLAEDLRQQIREMLAKGMDEQQITRYMTDRYGDFVLYRPPFKASTALLWVGPAVLMAVALGALLLVLRKRQRMAPEAFDPDTPDTPDDAQAGADAAPQATPR